MAFRDENEALRQRVLTLEDELAETQAELEELRHPPKVRVDVAEAGPDQARPTGSGLAAKVAAEERAQRSAAQKREDAEREKRRKAQERLAKHGSRLKVTRAGAETIIEVGPGPLREQLIDQSSFGLFFAAINPGIFIVMGLVALLVVFFDLSIKTSIAVAVPLWLTVLVALNLVYAHFARPRFRIAFDEDNFEVKQMGGDSNSALGRRKQLDVYVDDVAPGSVRLSHPSGHIRIEGLSQEDLDAMRALLVSDETEEDSPFAFMND